MSFLHNPLIDILYLPFLNILVLFYQYLPGRDFGVAIIALTVLIRLFLYPLMAQSIKSQKVLAELQPKIQEIQQRYKKDKEKQGQALMELYQKEKINPFGGCLPLLIQLPILIALFRVFWEGLRPEEMANLYSFVPNPGVINSTFLGIIDLSKSFIIKINDQTEYYWPALILAILAGVCQFFQNKTATARSKKSDNQLLKERNQTVQFSEIMQKQMLYFFPIFMVFILLGMPSAIGLYWTVTALFSIVQQHLIFTKQKQLNLT